MTTDPTSLLSQDDWIVGIGASAGGLEALSKFVANLPATFTAPIVIAQHLAPKARSMMVELLQRQSQRPVVSALEKEKLEPNIIYVIPPNYDADVKDGRLVLTVAGEETRPKPSINELFTSLANEYGAQVVGIVLSGTGTDGSDGIRAIKAAGGLTLAQDDESAKYDGMPSSAVHTGDVDAILPPDQMAKMLAQLLLEHALRKGGRERSPDVQQIFKLLKEKHGTDFSRYKGTTIHRRLIRRMSLANQNDYASYLDLLKESPGELAQLAKELLVSVTSFFRDSESYAALGELVARIVRSKRDGEEIRLWSAGCATGEEAYTLAIVFLEEIERQRRSLRLKVFATDLDQDALIDARDGNYTLKDIEAVPDRLRHRYFHIDDERASVNERLRECVVFARQDLTTNPPFVKIDLIACRNVLIYFNNELQERIIETFHYALNPSGIMFLGKSESVNLTATLFETIDRVHKIFGRLNVPYKAPSGLTPRSPVPNFPPRPVRTATGPSIAESSYLRLLRAYGICGVTIDEDCHIIHLIGDVSPFLGFFSPNADFRLTSLLPKGVGIEIPMLIRRASEDGKAHRSRVYREQEASKGGAFTINVRPLNDETELVSGRRLYIVNFEIERAVEPVMAIQPMDNQEEAAARIQSLEHELFVTREHLQNVVEELGVTNEELQSLNEELSSTNEELQASSEELETTNEELQSSNEELTTVNEELTAKNSEFRLLNLSFENVQNSIGIPMVLLDQNLRIVRYNPEALKLFLIGPGDIGKPLNRVSSHFETEGFNDRLRSAVKSGEITESLVEAGSSVYQMRVMPCYDENRSITGTILIFVDNTLLLRAQRRLKINEERLRAIVDGNSGPIFIKDSMGRYVMANDGFRKIFGLTDGDLIGRTDRELFPEALALRFREADLEVFMSRQPHESEETIEFENRKHHFLIRRFPMFEEDQRTPYAVGAVATEITSQVEAQDRLRFSESRYRTIVEDRFVFVARFTPDGHLTYTNRSFVTQFGREFEMPSNQTFIQVAMPEDRSRIVAEINSIRHTNPIGQFEHRIMGPDRKSMWMRWILRGVFSDAGTVTDIQAVGFDVTELRQQTHQLLEKDGIYSRVLDNTQDFLSVYQVVDGEFLLESFNRSAARALGQSHREMLGRNLRELSTPEKLGETLSTYRRAVEHGQPETFEQQIQTPEGVRHFSTNIVPIPSLDGRIERIAAMSRDVSDQKRTEKDLRRAKEEADAANRAKSEFLASMSHELRTPLNVVLGMAQLLGDTELNHEQAKFTSSIYRSGKVLLTLIEDVLDFSRIEAGKMSLDAISFSIRQVVSEVLDLFATPAKDKGLELLSDIDTDSSVFVIGDPARLRQVLVNLISNAVKFTDHGSVTIAVKCKMDSAREELRVKISVIDTGIGMPPEAHARLFQRFSQIDSGNSRKYGGSGLGLTISKNLVEMMHGTIGFDSKLGEGSRFFIEVPFPISQRQLATPVRKTASITPTKESGRALRILAVDDSDDSRAVIGHILARMGHDVTLAGSGLDALRKIETGNFEIILMDIQMPDIDGFEATRRVREMDEKIRRTPIVALTANALAGDAKRAFDAGMDDYITKPIQIQALKDLLAKWEERL